MMGMLNLGIDGWKTDGTDPYIIELVEVGRCCGVYCDPGRHTRIRVPSTTASMPTCTTATSSTSRAPRSATTG